MKMFQKKKKMLTPEQAEEIRIQEFLTVSSPVRSDFSPIILFVETAVNVCGQCGNGQPQPKNKRFWRTLQTEIL